MTESGRRAGEKMGEAIQQRMEGNQPAANANLEHARSLAGDAVREQKEKLAASTSMTNTPSSGYVIGTQANLPPIEQEHRPTLTETVGGALHSLKEGVVHTGSAMMEGLRHVVNPETTTMGTTTMGTTTMGTTTMGTTTTAGTTTGTTGNWYGTTTAGTTTGTTGNWYGTTTGHMPSTAGVGTFGYGTSGTSTSTSGTTGSTGWAGDVTGMSGKVEVPGTTSTVPSGVPGKPVVRTRMQDQ